MVEGTPTTKTPIPAGAVGRNSMDSTSGLDLCLASLRGAVDALESEDAAMANRADSCPARDWSQLQQDLLINIFSQLELPDLVYSGAVCISWHKSYVAIRRLRLCSIKQKSIPCLLV